MTILIAGKSVRKWFIKITRLNKKKHVCTASLNGTENGQNFFEGVITSPRARNVESAHLTIRIVVVGPTLR